MKCAYPYDIVVHGNKVTVSCGRCMCCRINRVTQWVTRILHETRCHDDSVFTCLTYSPKNLPENENLCKRDLQLFFKRLRKRKDFRYFACGEYGSRKKRPHYHVLLFGISPDDEHIVVQSWGKGIVGNGPKKPVLAPVNEDTARYTAGYYAKQIFGDDRKKSKKVLEFILCSRKPGIGYDFANKYFDTWLNIGYIMVNGKRRVIPKYYINKFNDEQLLKYKGCLIVNRLKDVWKKGVIEKKSKEQIFNEEYDERIGREMDSEGKQNLFNSRKFEV